MKTIINELNQAVALLEQFSVSGKLVDLMATAKSHIYAAQDIAQEHINKAEKKSENTDHAVNAANIAKEAESHV